jgi:hypothetical protein
MIIAFFAPGQYPPGAAALVFRRRRCPKGELPALMESAAAESLDGKRLDGKHLGKTRCST